MPLLSQFLGPMAHIEKDENELRDLFYISHVNTQIWRGAYFKDIFPYTFRLPRAEFALLYF